jgi:DNA-binding NtrC family response regulator
MKATTDLIFIVSSSPDYSCILGSQMAKENNGKVVYFRSAEDCLDALKSQTPKLIMSETDLAMTDQLSGYGLIMIASVQFAEIPIIAYSSVRDKEYNAKVLRAGVAAFVSTDVSNINLIKTALNYLSPPQAVRHILNQKWFWVSGLSYIVIALLLYCTNEEWLFNFTFYAILMASFVSMVMRLTHDRRVYV